MVGPIGFLIGVALLGGAGFSKRCEIIDRNNYNKYCTTILTDAALYKIKQTINRSNNYAGFEKGFNSDICLYWTKGELGYPVDCYKGEDLKQIEQMASGKHLAPYYAQALWLVEHRKTEEGKKLAQEVVEEEEVRRREEEENVYKPKYQKIKEDEIFKRKKYLYGTSPERFDNIFKEAQLPTLKIAKLADDLEAFEEMKEYLYQNELADPSREPQHPHEEHWGIKPSPIGVADGLDLRILDDEKIYGTFLRPDGTLQLKNKTLKASQEDIAKYWEGNKYLQYREKQKEKCKAFAEKYDLSQYGMDEYDIFAICLTYFGPKYSKLCRSRWWRDNREELFRDEFYDADKEWEEELPSCLRKKKLSKKDQEWLDSLQSERWDFQRNISNLRSGYISTAYDVSSQDYSLENINQFEEIAELRNSLENEFNELVESDEQFRHDFFKCVVYEMLYSTTEKELERIEWAKKHYRSYVDCAETNGEEPQRLYKVINSGMDLDGSKYADEMYQIGIEMNEWFESDPLYTSINPLKIKLKEKTNND